MVDLLYLGGDREFQLIEHLVVLALDGLFGKAGIQGTVTATPIVVDAPEAFAKLGDLVLEGQLTLACACGPHVALRLVVRRIPRIAERRVDPSQCRAQRGRGECGFAPNPESDMKTTTPTTLRDIDSLAGVREELRLQAHLFKAELIDRWNEAESRWQDLQTEIHALGKAVDRSRAELGAAASLAAQALRETYEDLRAALRPR